MDLSKYRALFVTESREHLEGISRDLLALERTPGDRALLDNLFRHAHSLKGMAASMGYESFALLSHKLEDIADVARRGVSFDQQAVDLWLTGADALTDMVGLVESGREAEMAVPAPLMEQIVQKAAAMLQQAPPSANATQLRLTPVVAPPPRPPPPSTAEMPTPSRSETHTPPLLRAVPDPARTTDPSLPAVAPIPGARTQVMTAVAAPEVPNGTLTMPAVSAREWLLTVVIGEQSATPHVRAFLVHKRVSEKTEVVDVTPPIADVRRGVLPERTLRMRVKGALEPAALESLVRSIPDVATCTVAPLAPAAPTAPAPGAAARPAAPDAAAARTVRVRTELLDELIDSVGEIMLARARLRDVANRLDDADLIDLADEFTRLSQGLHERVMSARMTPVSLVTDRLPRVVRDLSKKRGRDVNFRIEGAGIELDRAVLDELHDPVLHLVRNAVDHAHEGNAERVAAGKSATMQLTLSATRDRDHVLIEVTDDGKGMDPRKLRQAAIAKGVISPEAAEAMTDQEALELVCRPGFSTAETVNDTSGRGVGMDAVRATVEHLGGQLLIVSTVGKGTTFTLRLPLTVAIIRVLLVSAGSAESVYALPLMRVDHAQDFDPGKVVLSQGMRLYPVGDGLAPLRDLGDLLGWPVKAQVTGGGVVVLERQYRPLAVRVDRILGQQEVVVKPLGEPLASVPFLSGSALLADGRPAYILDVAKLMVVAEASAAA
ncbi:MAG: chemotaxis protein CheA [Myxococcota bacterium]